MIRKPARLFLSLICLLAVPFSAAANDSNLLENARNTDTGQAWFDYLTQCTDCSARREALGQLQAKQYAANGNLSISGANTGIASGGNDDVLLETARQAGTPQDWVNYLTNCQVCNARGEALGILQTLQYKSGGELSGLSVASTTPSSSIAASYVAANTGSEDDLLDGALINGKAIDWYSYLVGCSKCDERDTALNALQQLQYATNGNAFSSELSWVPGSSLDTPQDSATDQDRLAADAAEDSEWREESITDPEYAMVDTSDSSESDSEASATETEAEASSTASAETNPAASQATSPEENIAISSPETTSVASGEWDQAVGDSWGLALETSGHSRSVWRVAFSPVAPVLASASGDRSVIIYDLDSRDILHRLKAHKGYVNAIAFSPNGKYIASGAGDRKVIIWDVNSGTALRTLSGHNGDINALTWSQSGELLVSGSDDGRAIVWDSSNGNTVSEISETGADITALAISPDETTVATAGSDGDIRLYNSQDGSKLSQLKSHDGYTFDLAWSVDGKRLTSAGSDGAIRQWNLAGDSKATIIGQHPQAVTSIEFSANGAYLASSSFDGKVTIRDANDFSVRQTIKAYPTSAYSVAMTGDGRFVAASGGVKFIRIWRR